jgi:hypothetical protein
MNTAKSFDCVEMKRDIQERIRRKYAGIPEPEARRLQRQAALDDPVLGPFLRSLRKSAKQLPTGR